MPHHSSTMREAVQLQCRRRQYNVPHPKVTMMAPRVVSAATCTTSPVELFWNAPTEVVPSLKQLRESETTKQRMHLV